MRRVCHVRKGEHVDSAFETPFVPLWFMLNPDGMTYKDDYRVTLIIDRGVRKGVKSAMALEPGRKKARRVCFVGRT